MAFSPTEYCRLFAQKKAYKGGVTGTPGPPLATPLLCVSLSQHVPKILGAQRDAGTQLATALRRRPFSACSKGNRRRLHAGNGIQGVLCIEECCMWSGKSIAERTFRQNNFNALTNHCACGLYALNTYRLVLVLKHGNSCSRSEQVICLDWSQFPYFYLSFVKPEKRIRQVWKDSEATWTFPTFFSISYDDREYEQQDLQSSENQSITFLTLRS